ncbi:hypothetical protein DL96DRAFT_1599720 [Flagelloscypha sp. PMI_526]|nr:hypothetical protein DL96DRAFT_1599720 [Flagelloscypha sp. PMI_526]
MRSFAFLSAIALTLAGFASATPIPQGDIVLGVDLGGIVVADLELDIRSQNSNMKSVPIIVEEATKALGPCIDALVHIEVESLSVATITPITIQITTILETALIDVRKLIGQPLVLRAIAKLLSCSLKADVVSILWDIAYLLRDLHCAILDLVDELAYTLRPLIGDLLEILSPVGLRALISVYLGL